MPSLTFTYSAMNAGKTTELLQVAHNYEERNMNVILLSPKVDSRYGAGIIRSRIGIEKPSIIISNDDDLFDLVKSICSDKAISCVLVDESQFLTSDQVWQLSDIVDELNIAVMCYGLRTDSFGQIFEGSERLLAISDKIIERKTVCECGKKAIMVLRTDKDGNVVKSGKQVEIGGNDFYTSVCRHHYKIAFNK